MSDTIKDQDALYYPYIHLRNEEWLKTTLLYFPHVIRMIPPNYRLNDSLFVTELTQTRGRREEPLVGGYELDSWVAYQAGLRLADRLKTDAQNPVFRTRFSRTATKTRWGNDSVFQIHRDKLGWEIWHALQETELAWRSSTQDPEVWIALHPLIGETVMATAAAAVAKDQGLEIVTDAPHIHGVAACRDEETIYQTLVYGASSRPQGTEQPNIGEPITLRLAHLVFANRFDLSQLTVRELAAMSREGDALFDFRRMLAERVARIPRMDSETRREQYLKELAKAIVEEWDSRRRTLSKFMKRFIGAGPLEEGKGPITDLVKSLMPAALTSVAGTGATVAAGTTAGAVTTATLLTTAAVAAAPGLAVGLAFYGVKTWRALGEEQRSGPLRYLSLLKEQGAALILAAPPLAE